MNTTMFDTLARQTAAVSRRGSFRVLGGAALAAGLAGQEAARAGKAGKKARQRCKKQRGECLNTIKAFCALMAEPSSCEAGFSSCCEHFARCKAGQGIECLFSAG
jgi:hypothetical protein